jgi:D-glycero-D-manno-heptose 1,7-bisphosphate phosphatase
MLPQWQGRVPDPRVFERYRLFIFDADDTLRRTITPGKPCPHRSDEWVLMPGVAEVLRRVRWNAAGGPQLGIASNQDHVAYGHLTFTAARDLLRDLVRSATDSVPDDAALQICPHSLEHDCACRKPHPGMLIAIMRHYGVEPADTMFVGNHEVDREAAARGGTVFTWSQDFFGQLE